MSDIGKQDSSAASNSSFIIHRSSFLLFSLALIAFLVYFFSGAPGAWWGDGLELAAAAESLGVPHPTGYPLYMMLGHLVIRILGRLDAGRALTLFSSLLCAGSILLLGRLFYRRLSERARMIPGGPAQPGRLIFIAGGAMMIVAFTRTLWEHATFAEVYPLTLFLAMALVVVAFSEPAPSSARRSVAALGILWGLAMLNHYSIIALAPLVLLTLISWGIPRRRVWQNVGLFAAVAAPFLLGYLYLPIRAAADPALNWGDPSTPGRFFWMLTGGDYRAATALQSDSPGLGFWFASWGRQFLPGPFHLPASELMDSFPAALPLGVMIIAGALLGCLILMVTRPMLGLGLIASIIITAIFSILYRIPDRDAYFLPALPAVALGWFELGRLGFGLMEDWRPKLLRNDLLAALPLLAAAFLPATQYKDVNKSWDDGPSRWAGVVLDSVPPGSIVLTRSGADSEIYALWYEQIVNGRRPDVIVFGTGFIFKEWYGKYFEHESRPELPLFITEREPGDKSVFDIALAAGVILPNVSTRKIYATYFDPIFSRYMAPLPVATLLPEDYYDKTLYRLNPPGRLLIQLRPDLESAFIATANDKFRETFGVDPPSP